MRARDVVAETEREGMRIGISGGQDLLSVSCNAEVDADAVWKCNESIL